MRPFISLRGITLIIMVVLCFIFGRAKSESNAAPDDELISLVPILPSGQPVGTTILWVALFEASDPDAIRYRFSVGTNSSSFKIVRDFSRDNFFRWTPMTEGHYLIKVTAQNTALGQQWELTRLYEIRSRVEGSEPVVSLTTHPLVLLYSAPPCSEDEIRVRYRRTNESNWQHTPWQACQSPKSNNFYVAGLYENRFYEMQHEIRLGNDTSFGPVVSGFSRSAELAFPEFVVLDAADFRTSRQDKVLLQSVNGGPYELVFPVATDLAGEVIWYYRFREYENTTFPWHIGEYLARPLTGGTFLMFINYDGNFDYIVREIDLVGNSLRETNIERVNQQLATMGYSPIGYFHHEARRLSNDHTLLLGSTERILTDVQGEGPVNIVGDMVIDLDENLQVAWAWSAFDHLDVTRTAVLNEVCTIVTVGCPPLSLGPTANDWTHANAIAYTADDGNLLVSLRNQDWVIKIDYDNGSGSGDVLWRLGKDGDFALSSSLVYPWFSHQHDLFLDGDQIILFDNGNTRCEEEPVDCHSRGQVYHINEAARIASIDLNFDLGHYTSAFGSAQKLSNGNYHFTSGIILPDIVSRATEIRPNGAETFILETEGTQYRSFRMPDLYTPLLPNDLATPTEPEAALFLPLLRQ